MRFLLVFLFFAGLISCKSDPQRPAMNLMKYGLPISINAPVDAVIVADDMGIMQDVTIKEGDDYFIQIYGSEATTINAKSVFESRKSEIQAGSSFSEITLEEETGMIYKKQIDENTVDYDFIYVKIQGDKEYVFQTGLIGIFNEEQVNAMYQSVK